MQQKKITVTHPNATMAEIVETKYNIDVEWLGEQLSLEFDPYLAWHPLILSTGSGHTSKLETKLHISGTRTPNRNNIIPGGLPPHDDATESICYESALLLLLLLPPDWSAEQQCVHTAQAKS